MFYIIYVSENSIQKMYIGPVGDDEVHYLRQSIFPHLKPLSENEYMNGHAAILNTMAKFSYILDYKDVIWCIEWGPGLVVVRFGSNGKMEWTALRSPVPEFGGREPVAEDLESYDEDDEDYQYNLVFDAWDAQFDAKHREWGNFIVADNEVINSFNKVMDSINKLSAKVLEEHKSGIYAHAEKCMMILEKWCGDGVRI